jgi:hypothetical protein
VVNFIINAVEKTGAVFILLVGMCKTIMWATAFRWPTFSSKNQNIE